MYQYLNHISKPHGILNHVYLKDNHESTPVDIANLFNLLFYSVWQPSTLDDLSLANLDTAVPLSAQLQDISIDECDVYLILSSLDPSKAMGIDTVGPRILKYSVCSLCSPLTVLFKR